MEDENIIICIRTKDAEKLLPGAIPGKCSLCGEEVTLSPASLEIIKAQNPKLVCMRCVDLNALETGDVAAITSAQYAELIKAGCPVPKSKEELMERMRQFRNKPDISDSEVKDAVRIAEIAEQVLSHFDVVTRYQAMELITGLVAAYARIWEGETINFVKFLFMVVKVPTYPGLKGKFPTLNKIGFNEKELDETLKIATEKLNDENRRKRK